MVCFMTYSVYSLNFSSLFPQQSEYVMTITYFFLLSIAWTLLSMAWFTIYTYYVTKGEMPKWLYDFSGQLQQVPFCCFSPAKPNITTDQKNGIIENGKYEKSGGQVCIQLQLRLKKIK